MKGAIGNAFILNMVITFILIFYSLLIGSMAFSKAYKVKNYLLNSVISYDKQKREEVDLLNERFNGRMTFDISLIRLRDFFGVNDWNDEVNDYLSKIGYMINTSDKHCPVYTSVPLAATPLNEYALVRDTGVGKYDYCIYVKVVSTETERFEIKYMYKVLSYMRFDFPIIGEYIRLPLSGESKTITVFK